MVKRVRIYANKDADSRDLSEEAMAFMGVGGEETTDLELLKREDQYLLARQMICHHQQNFRRGSGRRGSGRPLTPRWRKVPPRAQNPPMATGTLETT